MEQHATGRLPAPVLVTVSAALAAALISGAAAAAAPDAYPTRPVRLVVAQAPGSSIDAMSRVVATKMGELLGEQLVIDNRTGAGGTIGGAIVAHAVPDG